IIMYRSAVVARRPSRGAGPRKAPAMNMIVVLVRVQGGNERRAISWVSTVHGEECGTQVTKALLAMQVDKVASPERNVMRVPLPTRRSSGPRSIVNRHPGSAAESSPRRFLDNSSESGPQRLLTRWTAGRWR